MKERLYSLDYLRGIAAFGIMIYHYLTWNGNIFTADTVLGRIGLYGVSIFYILSGLTLYYVYYNRLKLNLQNVLLFFKKRIFRIFPLLWIVTILSVIGMKTIPRFYDLFLNLTGLFGFIKWDAYLATGAWSIGNELVFYVFFPLFVLFRKAHKWIFYFFGILIFAVYLHFCFFRLDPSLPLENQWHIYINPLNQVFLFFAGFLIGRIFEKYNVHWVIGVGVLLIGVLIFVLYPTSGGGRD